MKKFICAVALGLVCSAGFAKYSQDDFRNFFGLGWIRSSNDEIFAYCKNVGYTHVMYKPRMENSKLAKGFTFFIETPEYYTYRRTVDFRAKYSKDEIAQWERLCAVARPDLPFPKNMATGWFFSENVVSMQLDMQQKKVRDYAVKKIVEMAERITRKNPDFKFGGFCWDVPQPHGDFNVYTPKSKSLNRQTTLAHWTGGDFTPERPGIVHDCPTYFEGYFEFYRALREAARRLNPDAKLIMEPYDIYNNWVKHCEGEFIKSKGAAAKKYMPDFLLAEATTMKFVENPKNFASGFFKKEDVGNSSPGIFSEGDMRYTAALAAINGSWTAFFGRYGGYNNAPHASSIRDIPARIKLGKLVAVWENLNNTPLNARKFENGIYASPTARLSPDVYWALQPGRDRIIFVFITGRGRLELPDGWEIESVSHLDGIFGECGIVPKGVLIAEGKNVLRPSGDYLAGHAFSAKLKKRK